MHESMSTEEADAFAADWFGGWNSHDLERVLAHYDHDVTFTSPFAIEFAGGSGTLVGKAALRQYWENALRSLPDLRFEPLHTVPGIGSLSLVYISVRDLLAVETMVFGDHGLVQRAHCHYRPRA